MSETLLPVPAGQQFGWISAIVAESYADSSGDSDILPDFIAAKGKLSFLPIRVSARENEPPMFVLQGAIEFDLDPYTGELRNLNTGYVGPQALRVGVWQMEYVSNDRGKKLTKFQFEVTAGHTESNPLKLPLAQPYAPPAGQSVTTLQVPTPVSGYVLGATSTGLAWVPGGGDGGGVGLSEATLAEVQGFWIVASPTEPTEPTMYGVPVVWVQTSGGEQPPDPTEPTQVTPVEPVFDVTSGKVTVPSVTGVVYKVGTVPVSGEDVIPAGQSRTFTASPASEMYLFPAGVATSWTYSVPDAAVWVTRYSDSFSDGVAEGRSIAAQDGSGAGPLTFTLTKTGSNSTGAARVLDGWMGVQSGTLIAALDLGRVKHAVEFDYRLGPGWRDQRKEDGFQLSIASSWGNHTVALTAATDGMNPANTKVAFSATSDSAWPATLINPSGLSWTALPATGKLRAESDGSNVSFSINGQVIARGPRSETANPSYAGDADSIAIVISSLANTTGWTEIDNLKIETMP